MSLRLISWTARNKTKRRPRLFGSRVEFDGAVRRTHGTMKVPSKTSPLYHLGRSVELNNSTESGPVCLMVEISGRPMGLMNGSVVIPIKRDSIPREMLPNRIASLAWLAIPRALFSSRTRVRLKRESALASVRRAMKWWFAISRGFGCGSGV